ncbi:PREDICTED: scarecrow-like protein 1 [Nicotiana attenuata]|uniref:Scarecrow-like protein 1 n=1 Tax=Nicotiana attenuata TaxID=49451 RepID=A0A1J6KKW3_NICAT|nr:PREDICTED: scarecrow-like protein 1 [Nicotiana attenuata]XP_019237424.1 PREDICTED: scarecrow-like protein 1 [Nicotiana attenuata]XP_019237425.1 PREDICTED: scarecrow-like protein 1 [Nicotiana attenuata]XP_019237426.1 PREDICTED: scarecrow-like protein 1 [Nicotiana attenuata]XP_019237427.1 PREDICTED: scarecrow-like protein 1 [Nicotiana attenuata]XP_019237428.1 PREDICTED: scarecrow-like protein 1 [Nicotiana attenuata]XP_019237429.1 PREDICTED: scarecrow-like protein 1 [Nicotiana attenuata]OIT2
MSLVRSVRTIGNGKLYFPNDHNDNSGLSTSMFTKNARGIMYATESSSTDSYDPKYLLDSPSPSEELLNTSASEVSGNPFHQRHSSSFQPSRDYDACQLSYDCEDIVSQRPDSLQYNDGRVTLKLQELERVLFDDNDVDGDDVFARGQCMDIDDEWFSQIGTVLLHDSPKESTSADSNISSSSSYKEISVTAPQTPKQMLFSCAAAIQDGNIEQASSMINELRQMVSIQGEPLERTAAYMVEALAARMATSGRGLYKALKCKEALFSERLSAMQVLFEVCPYFRFGFMAANGAILEAFKDEKRVHIIDFDINQGSQYYTLMQTLASMPGKPPHLRLTGVDDPESVQRAIGGLNVIGLRLEELAKDFKIPFEFQAVASNTALVTPAMLNCHPGEALIVNFAFQLHHMPDESVSTVNQRDQLLRMVKSLNPKLVTVVEQDMNTNTTPFLQRVAEVYNYYSAVFESLDATLSRDSQERVNVERQCLARDIINIVACEGEERIERYEVAGKWRARMMMAGLTPSPISRNVYDSIQNLIKQYSERYKAKEEAGALHFGWEDKSLIVASAWK